MIIAYEIFHRGSTSKLPSCAACIVCTGDPAAGDVLIGFEPGLSSVSLKSDLETFLCYLWSGLNC